METRTNYIVSEINIRDGCLVPYAQNWLVPSGQEIKIALSMAGYTGVEFATCIGVNDRTVRRWTGDEKPIAYAVWCMLCQDAGFGIIWK